MAIGNFISHVREIGLAQNNKYRIVFPDDDQYLDLMCDNVSIPGINHMTNEIRTIGELSEMVYGINYPPVQFSFILDSNFGAKRYFDKWSSEIFNRVTRNVGFYNVYAKQVDVFVNSRDGTTIYALRLHKAYPKAVSDIALNSGPATIIQCNVSLNFQYWEILDVGPNGEIIAKNSRSEEGSSGDNSGLEEILDVNSTSLGSNFGSNLCTYANTISPEFAQLGASSGALLSASGLNSSGEGLLGVDLGNLTNRLGSGMGIFGNGLNDLGNSVSVILAPIGKISTAIGGVSGTVRSIDTLLNKVGIKTGLGKISKDLAQLGGTIGVAGQMKGVVGDLKSIGANMGSLGGELNSAVGSLKTFPGATDQAMKSISNLGNAFSNRGSQLTDVAGGYTVE
jgi:hypothetical protein